jgi:hypothetical protein
MIDRLKKKKEKERKHDYQRWETTYLGPEDTVQRRMRKGIFPLLWSQVWYKIYDRWVKERWQV